MSTLEARILAPQVTVPTTAHATLVAARALIADECNWCQGAFQHYDAQSYSTRYCSYGAIRHVAHLAGFPEPPARTEQALQDAMGGGRPSSFFNDTRTHGEVLAAFDAAIEATR